MDQETKTEVAYKLREIANLIENSEPESGCRVEGCEESVEDEAEYERPHQPVRTKPVCQYHKRLNIIIQRNFGRFHDVFSKGEIYEGVDVENLDRVLEHKCCSDIGSNEGKENE